MLFNAYDKDENEEELIALGETYLENFPESPHAGNVEIKVMETKLKRGASLEEFLPRLQEQAL